MLVMLIGGLWHGASWTFVAWGGLHGLYIVINHVYRAATKRGAPRIGPWTGLLLTTLCVMVAWVFFRAETFAGGFTMLRGLVGQNGIMLPLHWEPAFGATVDALARLGLPVGFASMGAYSGGNQVLWVLLGFAAMWFLPNTQELMRRHDPAFEPVAAPCGFLGRLAWQPSFALGIVFAMAAVSATITILRGRAGEFIYFQF
jgi:hypothetical protein